jgi:response regulator of citrate/malate metabolism
MQKVKQCLIIDDDPDDQEIFEMCVKKISNNIKCVALDNGVDAVAMLKSNSDYIPDYIFIDVNMPKMNGIDCLQLLKNIERLQYSKIFMYSTTSELSVVENSKKLGANDFIVKPVKTTELKEKLSKIFDIVSEINPDNSN